MYKVPGARRVIEFLWSYRSIQCHRGTDEMAKGRGGCWEKRVRSETREEV